MVWLLVQVLTGIRARNLIFVGAQLATITAGRPDRVSRRPEWKTEDPFRLSGSPARHRARIRQKRLASDQLARG